LRHSEPSGASRARWNQGCWSEDDGYDIADYRGINPSYGTMREFRRFVTEAHDRGSPRSP
jgi:glycosidase